jgi:hypothetical protein
MNIPRGAFHKAHKNLQLDLIMSGQDNPLDVTIQFSPDNLTDEDLDFVQVGPREEFDSEEQWRLAQAHARKIKFELITNALLDNLRQDNLNPRAGTIRNTIHITGPAKAILAALEWRIISYAYRTQDLEAGANQEDKESVAPQSEYISLSKEEFEMLEWLMEMSDLQAIDIFLAARRLLEYCEETRAEGKQLVIYKPVDGKPQVVEETDEAGLFSFESEAGFPNPPRTKAYCIMEMICRPTVMEQFAIMREALGINSNSTLMKLALRRHYRFRAAQSLGYRFGYLK